MEDLADSFKTEHELVAVLRERHPDKAITLLHVQKALKKRMKNHNFLHQEMRGTVKHLLDFSYFSNGVPGLFVSVANRTLLEDVMLDNNGTGIQQCVLFVDGTFGVSPRGTQTTNVLIWSAKLQTTVPLAFFVSPGKSTADYCVLFHSLKNLGICPTLVMFDFEESLRKAARIVWPDAMIRGCYFHLVQAIWRRLNEKIDDGVTSQNNLTIFQLVHDGLAQIREAQSPTVVNSIIDQLIQATRTRIPNSWICLVSGDDVARTRAADFLVLCFC